MLKCNDCLNRQIGLELSFIGNPQIGTRLYFTYGPCDHYHFIFEVVSLYDNSLDFAEQLKQYILTNYSDLPNLSVCYELIDGVVYFDVFYDYRPGVGFLNYGHRVCVENGDGFIVDTLNEPFSFCIPENYVCEDMVLIFEFRIKPYTRPFCFSFVQYNSECVQDNSFCVPLLSVVDAAEYVADYLSESPAQFAIPNYRGIDGNVGMFLEANSFDGGDSMFGLCKLDFKVCVYALNPDTSLYELVPTEDFLELPRGSSFICCKDLNAFDCDDTPPPPPVEPEEINAAKFCIPDCPCTKICDFHGCADTIEYSLSAPNPSYWSAGNPVAIQIWDEYGRIHAETVVPTGPPYKVQTTPFTENWFIPGRKYSVAVRYANGEYWPHKSLSECVLFELRFSKEYFEKITI